MDGLSYLISSLSDSVLTLQYRLFADIYSMTGSGRRNLIDSPLCTLLRIRVELMSLGTLSVTRWMFSCIESKYIFIDIMSW